MKRLIVILLITFLFSAFISDFAYARLSAAGRRALRDAERVLRDRRADSDQIIEALKQLAYHPHVDVAEWLVEKCLPKLAEEADKHKAYLEAKETLIIIIRNDSSGESKEYVDKQVFNTRLPSGIRSLIADGQLKENPTKEFIIKVLNDPSPDMKLRALNLISIRTLLEDDYYPIVLKLLKDENVRVKRESLVILRKYLNDAQRHSEREFEIIEAFIERVQNDSTVVKGDSIRALKDFTGQDLGDVAEIWRSWLLKYKKGETAEDLKKQSSGTTVVFHGISTYSKRIVYIIDTSISMEEEIEPDFLEEIKRRISIETAGSSGGRRKPGQGLDWDKIKTRLDLAKAELIRSIEALPLPGEEDERGGRRPPRRPSSSSEIDESHVAFNIIEFSTNLSKWKDLLMVADEKNKKDAINWVNNLQTTRKTNIYGALSAAFDIAEGKVSDGRRPPAATGEQKSNILVDTIYFLTDGYATTGKYFGGLNEIREVYDTNKDDKISRQEFRGMFCDEFTDEEVFEMFDKIDTNSDGYLSISEDPNADIEFNSRWRTTFYFMQMKRMVEEFVRRNEMLKIQIHTIGIGEADYTTLKDIAKRFDGEYLALGGAKR